MFSGYGQGGYGGGPMRASGGAAGYRTAPYNTGAGGGGYQVLRLLNQC
jgi:hypothetical protein